MVFLMKLEDTGCNFSSKELRSPFKKKKVLQISILPCRGVQLGTMKLNEVGSKVFPVIYFNKRKYKPVKLLM